jgi:hypothetical protein
MSIAWSMEKTGGFTVQSAYNLALKLSSTQISQASSSVPDGDRKLRSHIWGGRVPAQVNVFVWKLCRDVLPTRQNKFRRRCDTDDCCPICNQEPKSSWHAVVACPQAAGLRLAMRKHWLLSGEEQFAYTGRDWLLLLLENSARVQRDLIKLLL